MVKLDDNKFLEIIKMYENTEGVYKIYALKNNKPKSINRLGSIDHTGLLYIGSTKNLKERLGMLYRVTHGANRGYSATAHSFGMKYNRIKIIRQLFPIETLFVDIIKNKNYKKTESDLLKEYLYKYGELTPLNSNYPQL